MTPITSNLFVGIAPYTARKPFTFAALNQDRRLVTVDHGSVDDIVAFLAEQPVCTAAVGAPPRLNIGMAVRSQGDQYSLPDSSEGDPAPQRLAEKLLCQNNMHVPSTPARLEDCPRWIQNGFILYAALDRLGFQPYSSRGSERQWLESNGYAAFCALLGHPPLPKNSVEGRIQRQLVLCENRLGVKDPMHFYEEITRHRLMRGVLPVTDIYRIPELDALALALTAWLAANRPQNVVPVGDFLEGQIYLPVDKFPLSSKETDDF